MIGNFLLAFLVLVWGGVNAPYGRYSSAVDKGEKGLVMRAMAKVDIPAKAAWVIQESPTLIAAAVCCATGSPECLGSWGNRLALFCFSAHYVNRTIVYPMLLEGSKPIPLAVVSMATMFCALNGYIQCRSLTRHLVIGRDGLGLGSVLGFALWLLGLGINVDSDRRLRNLRKPGETGYKIPRGGMFELVSGANFFGEILEWIGYALVTGCAMPGVTFALCTACNIGPRALAHHAWYREKFEDYPRSRSALVPFWPAS